MKGLQKGELVMDIKGKKDQESQERGKGTEWGD